MNALKKTLLIGLVLSVIGMFLFMYILEFPRYAEATKSYVYAARVISGGAAGSGSMDDIPQSGLITGDMCLVITSSNKFYLYRYDSTDETAENSPNIIAPDDGGTGRWQYVGQIQGKTVVESNITENTALSNEQVHNTFIQVTAACTVTLPKASTCGYGSTVCIYVRDAAETCIIEVDDADKINLHGTPLDVGDTIDSPGNAGDFIVLVAHTDADGSGGDGWITVGYGEAVWTDGDAS